MRRYRIYQLDRWDERKGGYGVMCASDEEAMMAARSFVNGFAAVEVWARNRRVGRLTPEQVKDIPDRADPTDEPKTAEVQGSR
jgi:hypothetical protein